jgi:actin-related protein
VGNEAQEKRDILAMKYPISSGELINWDDATKLWHRIFFNGTLHPPLSHFLSSEHLVAIEAQEERDILTRSPFLLGKL